MRGLGWLVLAVGMISLSPAARAATVLSHCTTGCTTDSSGSLTIDYTVPSDGMTYRWDLYTDPSHPTATITLQLPNEVSGIDYVSNGDGTTTPNYVADPGYIFNEVSDPGHTIITVWSNPSFNNCTSTTAAGTLCRADNSVFGNGASLTVDVDSPVTITFAQTALGVPEPAVWSLMIVGFGTLGWALRRRRAVDAQAV